MHHEGIPLAVRRIDHSSLCIAEIMETKIIIKHFTSYKLTVQRIGHQTDLAFTAAGTIMTSPHVIATIMLVYMTAFISQISIRLIFGNDAIQSACFGPAQVSFQLRQMQLSVSVDDVHTTIVVIQHAVVIVEAFNHTLRPRAGRITRFQYIGFLRIV